MLLRGTIEFEHAALRPFFLLNGGALVVSLAFLSAVLPSEELRSSFKTDLMVMAVLAWCAGLVFAVLATGFGYIAQKEYYEGNFHGIQEGLQRDGGNTDLAEAELKETEQLLLAGNSSRKFALAAGVLSLAAFIVGVAFGFTALLGFGVGG